MREIDVRILNFLIDLTTFTKQNNIPITDMQSEIYKIIDGLKPLGECCDYDTYLFALHNGIILIGEDNG